jgi:hypothetical protein
MLITADEAASIIQRAIRESARKIGVQDVDYIPAAELLPEIQVRDAAAHALVLRFAVAYGDWFRLVQRLEVTHPGGAKEDAAATKALIDAINERDESRAALLKWMRSQ